MKPFILNLQKACFDFHVILTFESYIVDAFVFHIRKVRFLIFTAVT